MRTAPYQLWIEEQRRQLPAAAHHAVKRLPRRDRELEMLRKLEGAAAARLQKLRPVRVRVWG